MKKLATLLISFSVFSQASLFAIPLPDGTDARITDVKQTNGKITYVHLREKTDLNTPIGSVKATGDVYFFENGKIQKLTPAETGSYTGKIGTLSYDDDTIEFYESGAIKTFTSRESTINTPCGTMQAAFGTVVFYDNWIPSSCSLKENIEFQSAAGKMTAKGRNRIYFDSNGALISFTVSESHPLKTSVGNVYPKEDTEIYLYANGQIKSIIADDMCMINSDSNLIFTKSSSPITFYEDGKVKSVVTDAGDFSYGAFTFSLKKNMYGEEDYEKTVNFYEDGSIAISSEDYRYNNFVFKNYDYGQDYSNYGVVISKDRKTLALYERENSRGSLKILESDATTMKQSFYERLSFENGSRPNLFEENPLKFNSKGKITGYATLISQYDKNTDDYYYKKEFVTLSYTDAK